MQRGKNIHSAVNALIKETIHMKNILVLKIMCMIAGALVLCSCATTQEATDHDEDDRFPPLTATAEVMTAPQTPASVPDLPPPLIPLKRPEQTMDLETMVSLSVTEGYLREVLQALAEQAQVSMIVDRDVTNESVTLNVRDLPLWQALHALLTSHNLYYSVNPGYVRVSRMMTRVFHIDYVRTLRRGSSSTQVSLASGGTDSGASSSNSESSSSLGRLGSGTSSGDITIENSAAVDFWVDLSNTMQSILRDPLYRILRAEYDQRDLQRDLVMLPYKEEYERERLKHSLEMFRLERELTQRRLDAGISEEAVDMSALSPMETESGAGETDSETEQSESDQEDRLVGTYSIDPQTGTLVVTTTQEVMDRVESYLSEVRQNLSRQVTIDVRILEVTLRKESEMGVDWTTFPGSFSFYNMPGLTDIVNEQMAAQGETGGGGSGTSGSGGVASPINTSPFASSTAGGVDVGVLNTIGDDSAFQYNISGVVSFLQQHGDVKAISRPQITTLNNQPAVVSVGVNDFYVTFEQQTTSSDGGLATSSVTSTLNPIFIGVSLNITPQISPEGLIAMTIVPAVNELVGTKTVPTGLDSAPTQEIPILETRQTSTLVKAQSDQTIIISGLINERKGSKDKEVPFLCDIPLIGNLFRFKTREEKRSELVFLLTPRLADFALTMEQLGYNKLSEDQ